MSPTCGHDPPCGHRFTDFPPRLTTGRQRLSNSVEVQVLSSALPPERSSSQAGFLPGCSCGTYPGWATRRLIFCSSPWTRSSRCSRSRRRSSTSSASPSSNTSEATWRRGWPPRASAGRPGLADRPEERSGCSCSLPRRRYRARPRPARVSRGCRGTDAPRPRRGREEQRDAAGSLATSSSSARGCGPPATRPAPSPRAAAPIATGAAPEPAGGASTVSGGALRPACIEPRAMVPVSIRRPGTAPRRLRSRSPGRGFGSGAAGRVSLCSLVLGSIHSSHAPMASSWLSPRHEGGRAASSR
jgi:hypothetical protein